MEFIGDGREQLVHDVLERPKGASQCVLRKTADTHAWAVRRVSRGEPLSVDMHQTNVDPEPRTGEVQPVVLDHGRSRRRSLVSHMACNVNTMSRAIKAKIAMSRSWLSTVQLPRHERLRGARDQRKATIRAVSRRTSSRSGDALSVQPGLSSAYSSAYGYCPSQMKTIRTMRATSARATTGSTHRFPHHDAAGGGPAGSGMARRTGRAGARRFPFAVVAPLAAVRVLT